MPSHRGAYHRSLEDTRVGLSKSYPLRDTGRSQKTAPLRGLSRSDGGVKPLSIIEPTSTASAIDGITPSAVHNTLRRAGHGTSLQGRGWMVPLIGVARFKPRGRASHQPFSFEHEVGAFKPPPRTRAQLKNCPLEGATAKRGPKVMPVVLGVLSHPSGDDQWGARARSKDNTLRLRHLPRGRS